MFHLSRSSRVLYAGLHIRNKYEKCIAWAGGLLSGERLRNVRFPARQKMVWGFCGERGCGVDAVDTGFGGGLGLGAAHERRSGPKPE